MEAAKKRPPCDARPATKVDLVWRVATGGVAAI